MKSEKTKELIENSFFALLKKYPIKEISVNEIAEESGVNRNTFYYHFKNIPDLLESVTKRMMDKVMSEYPPSYESYEDSIAMILKMAKENEKIIYNIYNSSNRKIFERHLWHVLDYSILSFVNSFQQADNELSEEEMEILVSCFRYMCFGFIIDWINKGMPEVPIEKLTALFGHLSKIN